MTVAEYNPAIFTVGNRADAKRIILTPEAGSTTDERWERETPYLADLIEKSMTLGPENVLLDFGCGIGRLAKEIIARTGCRVIGVDISASMRALAADYVSSDRFMACSPEMLIWIIEQGMKFDGALAVWVLQHCRAPTYDIALICRSLRTGGVLFVVNNKARCVPTTAHGWVSDGLSVADLLAHAFGPHESGKLDPAIVPEVLTRATFWAAYTK